jgi:hypothetical protein
MVAANETLEASTNAGVSKVLTELDGLVHAAVTIPEVSTLGITQVDVKALIRATNGSFEHGAQIERLIAGKSLQADCTCEVKDAVIRQDIGGAKARDHNLEMK